MERTVNAKTVRSLNKSERAVLLPGQTGAEPWEVWILGPGVEPRCVQTCMNPVENRLRKNTTLALPVAQVFCVPLWLNETDLKQLAGMIPLQLEMRGLQPRGGASLVFEWSVVDQQEARTLVMVCVLPGDLPKELQVEAYDTFDLSLRYMAFPENSLTIWLEQDQLVAAITRGPNIVYFQALSERQLTSRVIQDLTCAKITLAMQDILQPLQQVVAWTEISPAESKSLQSAFQVPVRQAECPGPTTPSASWKLTPASVNEARRAREVQKWKIRGVLIALAIYLLVIAGFSARFFSTSLKVNELQKWQDSHAEAIQTVRNTRTSWKELSPALDQDSYPLELLFHVSQAIPSDQLHLTLFEVKEGHLLIKGEAKNASSAFQFSDKLKLDPHFAGYTWDMGQPHLLPNDLAQFQIEGSRANSN